MPEFKLHCFAESGNAYKAALMLNLIDADWQPIFVKFFQGQTRTQKWREDTNEMGEVPVLIHGERKLTQSGVILDYLACHSGRFMPPDEDGRRDVWRWILWDNHKFTSYHATNRFLRFFQKQGETPVTEFLAQRAEAARVILENHLTNRDWISGKSPSIADISIAGYMFYPEDEIGFSMADYPAMLAWVKRIESLPKWIGPYELMPSNT